AIGPRVVGWVQEDGMSLGTGDHSEGNKEGGDDNTGDEASGPAGSLATPVKAGADEPLKFGLSDDTSGLPNLLSHGEELQYSVTDNVLTASTKFGTVFTLTVNADGSWSFDLQDQLDHVTGGGDNSLLQTVGGGAAFMDLSSVITATDADGDSVGA